MSEERVKRWMPPHRFKFRVVDVGAPRRARAEKCPGRCQDFFFGREWGAVPLFFVECIKKKGVVCSPAAIVNDNLVVHRIAGKNPSGLKNFLGNRKYGVGSVMERGATRWRWTRILHGECDDITIIAGISVGLAAGYRDRCCHFMLSVRYFPPLGDVRGVLRHNRRAGGNSPNIPFRVALSCATEGNEGRLVNMSLKLYA